MSRDARCPLRPRTLAGLLVLLLAAARAPGPAARGDDAPPGGAAAPPAPASAPAAEVHEVGAGAVVDGDTLDLPGGPRVRVLGLDAEESFKSAADRATAAADFAAYAKAKRGDSGTPVKYATPLGDAAVAFVRDLLGPAKQVRLEPDAWTERLADRWGRRLAHVVCLRPDGEVLLAEAVIRAGYSPYFVKYGRSVRYDARLRAAEDEARAAGRGIWGTTGPAHYPDYAERIAWWTARADQVDRWRASVPAEDRVTLGVPSESARLPALEGREISVFGEVASILPREGRRPWVLVLPDAHPFEFKVVVFDPKVWAALDHAALGTRYVTVRGPLTFYRGEPQIVVRRPEQVSLE